MPWRRRVSPAHRRPTLPATRFRPGAAITDAARSEDATPSDRLFRFGFVCHPVARALPGGDGWSRLRDRWRRAELGPFVLHLHPETTLAQHTWGETRVALLGHAFTHASLGEGDPVEPIAAAAADGWEALHEWLDRTSGRFALLVLRPDGPRLYHDPSGSRTVFYESEKHPAIASHAELLALAVDAKRSTDIGALIDARDFRKLPVAHLPGDATLFEGVHALPPNHFLDVGSGRIARFWPRRERRVRSFDAFAAELDDYLRGFAHALRPPRRPVLGVTGGIDSRLLMAAFSHHGLAYRGLTWRSFNFEEWEEEPVRALVEHLKIPHQVVDRSNDSVNDAAWVGVRNSGGYRPTSRAVAGMARLYADDPRAVFVRGMGAETLRGFYGGSPRSTPPDLRPGFRRTLAMLRHRTLPARGSGPARSLSTHAMYRRYIVGLLQAERVEPSFEAIALARFRAFRRRADYGGVRAYGYRPDDLFYWEHRMGMWASASLNASDPALDSRVGFNSRAAAEAALGLADEERLAKHHLLRVIRRYDPELASIPYR